MNKQILFLIFASACNAASLSNILNDTICGIAPEENDLQLARIYGGINSSPGSHPWMAYIYDVNKGPIDGYICGGALINSEWIVTAAHCVVHSDTPDMYRIVLGEHKASSRSGLERDFKVSEAIRHEDYDSILKLNDIAMLRLENAVTFSSSIRPACLPNQGFPTDANEKLFHGGEYVTYAGKTCTILGWSETETKWKSDVLKKRDVTILPRILCTSLTSQVNFYTASVHEDESRFCAGRTNGEHTCSVQGGGPLLCKDDSGRYHLHGITSYGPEPCGEPFLPGVYTEISAFSDWIQQRVEA